ncbi:LamG domain-containing protein [Glycomyces dulcitolivorans]|uniref:LamG domain-containing protein n=1 Tax=Glycomyces dulcitolivorans TaxID=2200759 RepID=UPI000DD4CA25|nr:LamG domain-containing protein [Glycomyces dulcitolivorans]
MSPAPDRVRAALGAAAAIPLAVAAFAVPAAAQTYDPVPVPVATWRFEGDGLDDATAGAHLDAAAGLAFTADRIGRSESALLADGTASGCAVSDAPAVNTLDSFTVAAWVRPDAFGDADQTVLSQRGPNGPAFTFGWDAETASWQFSTAKTRAAGAAWNTVAAPATAAGEWHHLAAAYDLPAQQLRIYIDGQVAASASFTLQPWDADGIVTVGCTDPAAAAPAAFTGAIDDLVVAPKVFTPARIGELAAGDHLPAAAQAWWPLRSDLLDASGRAAALDGPAAPAWSADQFNRADSAVTLDGTECLSADAAIRTDDSFTASAWVRLDAVSSDGPTVLNLRGGDGRTVRLKYNASAGTWQFVLSDGTDRTVLSADAAVAEWTHLAAVYDAVTSTATLVVNGVATEAAVDHEVARASTLTVGCNREAADGPKQPWEGAISQVRLWRGIATAEEITGTAVETVAFWDFSENLGGTDGVGDRDMVFNGAPVYNINRWGACEMSLEVDPDSPVYGTALAPFRTDESFSATVWVRPDDLSARRTILAQSGTAASAFELAFEPATGTWVLESHESDAADASVVQAVASAPAVAERWYHLAVVYDIRANSVALYVDGVLSGASAGPSSPWPADGAFSVGATGAGVDPFSGFIDQVRAVSGVLDAETIAEYASQTTPFPPNPGDVGCGDDEPPVIED